jgi:hypothetical protein
VLRRAARPVVLLAAGCLAVAGCEPLDTGSSAPKPAKTKASHRVVTETSRDGKVARRSGVARSGSSVSVTSRSSGSGKVTCRIVIDGQTVSERSGSGAVSCGARVTR